MTFPFQRSHFEPPTDRASARALFQASVTTVLLELTEHCNRRCTYCPVSIVPRLKNRTLPSTALEKIISNLEEIDYSGSFCLNLYNEPTADEDMLLPSIAKIRARLPKSRIYFSTNGDYLTREYLDKLFDSGLSQLTVTLHVPPADRYNDEDAISRFIAFGLKLGTLMEVTRFSAGMYVHAKLKYKGYPVTVFTENFEQMGCDRAGAMKNVAVPKKRNAPCMRPFETMTVAFDGRMFPCCQFYPDLPENGRFSIGHIDDYPSLFDAYASPSMAEWRRSLFRYGPKASPCDTCLEADAPASQEVIDARGNLAEALGV